jgi:hypothetical protein
MNSTNVLSEGALYELVSRGNKDVYFYSDEPGTLFPYDNRYIPTPPIIHELREMPPLQAADFGRSIEFEFEIAGDVVVEPTLLIQLPTWLPEAQAEINYKSYVTDTSGVSYGYTRGIAYFLFEKIQFFQDTLLVQEWSGDGLWNCSRSRGSMNSAFLENALTGNHDGSVYAISKNATPGPGLLRLSLPLVGCQDLDDGGFPRVAAVHQSFRIRCFLRKLDQLVEASDGRPYPIPWNRTDFQIKTSQNGAWQPFSTLDRLAIGKPTITLQTRHIYTDRTNQDAMRNATLVVPFEREYDNHFTQGALDYTSTRRGGIAQVTRRLDADHPAGRMVMAWHSVPVLRANQYWRITADLSGGQFYNNLSLIIAGRDRESSWDSLVWSLLEQHAKEERDSGYNLSFMNWTLGDINGRFAPFPRQLDGTLNFTSADRPTLLIDLSLIPIDPVTKNPNSTLDVYIEGWAALEFERGRSAMLFGN